MANFTPQEIEQMLQEFFDVAGKRQYIGARYVPIFGRRGESSIDWDNSAPYEPLTIVIYQGNSYTSRTYVPAGVDITNENYWALSGAYNAQVESYRREVIQLQNDWIEWKEQTESDIEDWESDVRDDFDEWKQEALDDVSILVGQSGEKILRKALYIGNSYTYGYGNDNKGTYYYSKHYFQESDSETYGGCAFHSYAGRVTVNTDFKTLLINASGRYTESERESFSHIIVISAVGDDRACRDTTVNNYRGYVYDFCKKAKELFPNATVHLFLASAYLNYGDGDVYPWTIAHLNEVYSILQNNPDVVNYVYHGIISYPLMRNSGRLYTDHYHPNDDGYRLLAQNLIQCLGQGTLNAYNPNVGGNNTALAFAAHDDFTGTNSTFRMYAKIDKNGALETQWSAASNTTNFANKNYLQASSNACFLVYSYRLWKENGVSPTDVRSIIGSIVVIDASNNVVEIPIRFGFSMTSNDVETVVLYINDITDDDSPHTINSLYPSNHGYFLKMPQTIPITGTVDQLPTYSS